MGHWLPLLVEATQRPPFPANAQKEATTCRGGGREGCREGRIQRSGHHLDSGSLCVFRAWPKSELASSVRVGRVSESLPVTGDLRVTSVTCPLPQGKHGDLEVLSEGQGACVPWMESEGGREWLMLEGPGPGSKQAAACAPRRWPRGPRSRQGLCCPRPRPSRPSRSPSRFRGNVHLPQVSEKLKLAERTAQDIDRLRDGYRPAARRGAILFFVLSEMALVNSMYQYSLIAFLEVFGLSLKKSLPDSALTKRLRNIMDTLTFNIYNYGCTGERQERTLTPRYKGTPEAGMMAHACAHSTPGGRGRSVPHPKPSLGISERW